MGAVTPDSLRRLVEDLLMLCSESAAYHRHADVRAVLDQAVRTMATYHRRLELAARRYVVAVVGLTNVGKSTLLNALLGSDLAPRRNGPCTAAPIEFVRGPKLRVTAYFRQAASRRAIVCSDTAMLHTQLAAWADDRGDIARSIRKVVVELPNDLLAGGLVVADTPGFGAAQTGSDAGSHDAAVEQYLQQDVSQVFWIVLAEQGIGKREMQFHDRFFAEICDDIAVTGCEDWDDRDRERFRQRFMAQFNQRIPAFHFVSGLEGLRSRQSRDAEGLEAAGIPLLEARIRQLADPRGRLTSLSEAIDQLVADLASWLFEFRDERGQALQAWWRPDSWLRWSSAATRHATRQRVHQLLTPKRVR
jgi:GTP-binding protein EngB required for normal cell division